MYECVRVCVNERAGVSACVSACAHTRVAVRCSGRGAVEQSELCRVPQPELPGAASQQGECALEAQGPGLRDPLPPIVGGARRWPWLGLSAL